MLERISNITTYTCVVARYLKEKVRRPETIMSLAKTERTISSSIKVEHFYLPSLVTKEPRRLPVLVVEIS